MIAPTLLLPLLLAAGDTVLTKTVDGKETVVATVVAAAEDDEDARWKRLAEIHALSRSGHPEQALPQVDALLAEYATRYPPGPTRWYVARDTAESLAYSILATTALEGSGQTTAQVLTGVAWADAYFVKAWALVELRRLDEAREALDRALQLAPWSAENLIERAEVSKLERKWNEAMEDFVAAEEFSTFSPEHEQKAVKGQAMRGQAFVHVELGAFDAAERVLKACLELDPDDQKAKDELAYIAKQRQP